MGATRSQLNEETKHAKFLNRVATVGPQGPLTQILAGSRAQGTARKASRPASERRQRALGSTTIEDKYTGMQKQHLQVFVHNLRRSVKRRETPPLTPEGHEERYRDILHADDWGARTCGGRERYEK